MLASAGRTTRLLAAAALLGAALALQPAAPAPLRAGPDCTTQYEECITEASLLKPILREMAYIECLTEWTGCVLEKL